MDAFLERIPHPSFKEKTKKYPYMQYIHILYHAAEIQLEIGEENWRCSILTQYPLHQFKSGKFHFLILYLIFADIYFYD